MAGCLLTSSLLTMQRRILTGRKSPYSLDLERHSNLISRVIFTYSLQSPTCSSGETPFYRDDNRMSQIPRRMSFFPYYREMDHLTRCHRYKFLLLLLLLPGFSSAIQSMYYCTVHTLHGHKPCGLPVNLSPTLACRGFLSPGTNERI